MRFSFSRSWVVSSAHLRTWRRNRSSFFWTLIFPILLMVLFGGIFSFSGSGFDLYVQNNDIMANGLPTPLSESLIRTLNSTQAFEVRMVPPSQNMESLIHDKNAARILMIPNGFQSDTEMGSSVVLLRYDQSQASSSSLVGIVKSVLDGLNAEIAGIEPIVSLQQENMVSNSLRFIDFFMPGVVGISIMTTGVFGAITTNTKYRTNGVLRKLATTPLGKLEWISGMIFYQLILSILGAVLVITVGTILFGIAIRPTILTLLILVSGGLAFPGLGMIVARLVKDEESADAAGNAVTFPMMFLSGTFFPLDTMPEIVQIVASFMPLTYVNEGLRNSMLLGNPEAAFGNAIIVLLFALVAIVFGSLITSWRDED